MIWYQTLVGPVSPPPTYREPGVEYRTCGRCGGEKPSYDFQVHPNTGNLRGTCRACMNKMQSDAMKAKRAKEKARWQIHTHCLVCGTELVYVAGSNRTKMYCSRSCNDKAKRLRRANS